MIDRMLSATLAFTLLSCGPANESAIEDEPANRVATSGKNDVALRDVPPEVIAAVRTAQPDLTLVSAEAETRDGRSYFDVGGTLPDRSEVELDVMEDGGRWQVVETQRDIAFSAAPAPVRDAARSADPALRPTRVIESRQEDGLVIYELFSPAGSDRQGRKVEITWDGKKASVLTQEWAH